MKPSRSILLEPRCLDRFIKDSIVQYQSFTPGSRPRCWGVLVGRLTDETIIVTRVCAARNVRHSDGHALDEFKTTCASKFGAIYANPSRGFWCHPLDVLKISRQAASSGEDVLGSIHLHPDWHHIGPAEERRMVVNEKPTPLDDYLYWSTGWPLNMILYLEQREDSLHSVLSAWAPPEKEGGRSRELQIHTNPIPRPSANCLRQLW